MKNIHLFCLAGAALALTACGPTRYALQPDQKTSGISAPKNIKLRICKNEKYYPTRWVAS